MDFRILSAVALIVAAIAAPVTAQRAVDGDTIDLDGTRYRLWGIDAPESRQTCKDGWQAGVEAKHELEQLMAREPVHCEERGHDRYRHYRPMQGRRAGSRRGHGAHRHGLGIWCCAREGGIRCPR